MPQYGEADYWEQRYKREPASFDWYQGYHGLKYLLHQWIPLTGKLLHVGVGTSRLQEDMARNGYQSILNIDYSAAAISHMSQLHKENKHLTYQVADVRKLPFEDNSFNGVLDKGTMDAILCGEASAESCKSMLKECERVLTVGGVFMVVTYGDPCSRLLYIDTPDYNWSVDVYCVTKPESADNLATFSQLGNAIVKGPYPSTQMDMMDSLSLLQNVHYVYICRKITPMERKKLRAAKTKLQSLSEL